MTKVFEGSLDSEETGLFKAIHPRLVALLHASQNVLADAVDKPAPGSPSQSARKKQAWDAYEQLNPLLFSAEDHLRAIVTLLEGGALPTFALYTLLRAAATASVRCAYLLDTATDERERMARGLNLRLENLIEQDKFVRDSKVFAKRVAVLEERARAHEIEVRKRDAAKPATAFGHARPSEVELFRTYLRPTAEELAKDPDIGEQTYRYLSGYAHSMLWVKLSGADAVATDEPGVSSVKMELDFRTLAAMFSMVLRLHESNLTAFLGLSGYPLDVWKYAMKTAVAEGRARYMRLAEGQARRSEPLDSATSN